MSSYRRLSVAATVLLISFVVDTEAFYAFLSKARDPGGDFTHRTLSHEALLKVVARYLEDNPRPGSSVQPGDLVGLDPLTTSRLLTAYYGDGQVSAVPLEEAILEMIEGNMNVDFYEFSSPEPHMNAEKFKKANRRLQDTRDVIIQLLQESQPDYSSARSLIGEYLHIVQDFYSNANWVEMKGPVAYEDLGLSGVSILPVAKSSEYTCKGCDDSKPGDCDNNLIVGGDTLTSGYRSGQGTKKRTGKSGEGKCSHGGSYDSTRKDAATGGINKESRDPTLSPHYSMHQDAATSAMLATENFFLASGAACEYECGRWDCLIRKDFILNREGGIKTDGYVPKNSTGYPLGQSGVTIGSGVDLGSKTRQYFIDLGVPSGVIAKLEPYFGLKKHAAVDKLLETPLTLTYSEAEDLSYRVMDKEITDIAELYDSAVDTIGDDNLEKFGGLTVAQRTVIASVYFQYGGPPTTKFPTFWGHVTNQRWEAAISELRDFKDSYPTRRNKEADLLQQDSKDKTFCPDPNHKEYGLKFHISDGAFLGLFNLGQNSSKSLSIAMDVTGSMSDDIQAAKEECHRLIDELAGTVNEPANYVLVPFSDPDYGPVFVTTDPDAFKVALSALHASGGGDCPELSMTGTELAVEHSLPGSDLFVFTDASAKDTDKTEYVHDFALERNVQVSYLLTGTCGYARRSVGSMARGQSQANHVPSPREHSRRKRSLDAYRSISEATGGVVLEVTKEELKGATEIISRSFEGAEVSILIVDLTGNGTVTFPVDNTVSQIEITVAASDTFPDRIDFAVTDQNGLLWNDTKEIVNKRGELIVVINATEPGEWGLTLNDNAQWHIVVNATSPIDFLYTFYSEDDAGQMIPLYGSPALDQEVSLIISITGQEHVSSVSQLIFTTNNGTDLKTIDVTLISVGSYLAQTQIPREDFGIQLNGLDSKSVEFQRRKSVDVKVQSMSVVIQNGVRHSLDPAGIPLQINFTIRNHGDETDNYTVMAQDDLFVEEYFPYNIEIPAKSTFDGYIIAAAADNETESGLISAGSLKVTSDGSGTSNEVQFKLVVMDYLEYYREIDDEVEDPTDTPVADGGAFHWSTIVMIAAVSVMVPVTGVAVALCCVRKKRYH